MTVSLTTRLLVFFLATLALVLAGFSTSLYVLARTYLDRQANERLASALNTLEAVVDREGPGLEWEAKDRHLALGAADGPDAVCWLESAMGTADVRGRLRERRRPAGRRALHVSRRRTMPSAR